MVGHGLTRSVAIKVREIWSVLFSRPSFIPLPFSSVHFFRFLAWKGRSSSPSCSPLFISPLQSSLAQVSAFKMILFFISRFLCTTPPCLPLPPSSSPPLAPSLLPTQTSRRENKERNEYYLQPLFSRRKSTAVGIKPPEYSCFLRHSDLLLARYYLFLALFFLTHRIKKAGGGRDTIRPYEQIGFVEREHLPRQKAEETKQERRLTKWKREWDECIVIYDRVGTRTTRTRVMELRCTPFL